ncbi:NADH-quinone oxidoreductase subunit J [Candidatus Palauibacter sp.]|uniref:NADH-quinone oxidoreductase subunit J n=1 Tax=Candidatus Palauibacter sp. TaxID=3101350 RepID=UPI003B5B9B3D
MIQDFLFQAFAASAILGAVIMVTRRNPVTAVIFLVGVFFATSGMFLMLDAHYVAAINVILYGGAIMVLFLFVLMLLNLGHADWRDLRGPVGGLVGGSIGIAFLGILTRLFIGGAEARPAVEVAGHALRATIEEQGVIGVVARPLFEEYAIVLEVTGVLLLVSIVGTILLARRERA